MEGAGKGELVWVYGGMQGGRPESEKGTGQGQGFVDRGHQEGEG